MTLQTRSSRRFVPAMFVVTTCIAAASAHVPKQGPHPTCADVAAQVLEPHIKAVETAMLAEEQYRQAAAADADKLRDRMNRYRRTRELFAEGFANDKKKFDDRIGWAREAIDEAREAAEARIATLREEAERARVKGDERLAENREGQVRSFTEKLAMGEVGSHKKELSANNTINGWKDYIKGHEKQRDEKLLLYSKGEVGLHASELNATITWKQALKSMKDLEEKLAEVQARKPRYHLPAINAARTGAEVDKLIADRKKKLADLRAELAAGTYRIFVPTMGRTMSRNDVQALIAKKKEEARKVVTDWAAGEYKQFNPMMGRTPTNGWIEKEIEKRQKTLNDYIALGDDARAWCMGRDQTARSIKEQKTRAFARNDDKRVAACDKMLAEWQKSRDEHIEKLRKYVKNHQEYLEEHQRVKEKDLKEREEYIERVLVHALEDTPCGGTGGAVDPRLELVKRHRDKLAGMSESEGEKNRRLSRYGDKVHVDEDGTVHGDLKKGLENATRDDRIATPQKKSRSIPELIELIKNQADVLQGYKDLKDMKGACDLFDRFIHAAGNLDMTKPGTKKFRQRMRELRSMADEVNDVFQSGVLNRQRIQGLLDGLKSSTRKTEATKRTIEALQALLSASTNLNRQWSASNAINYIRTYAGPLGGTTGQYCTTSLSQLPQRLGNSWKSMSGWDKSMLGLSVLAAGANAYNRMEAGTEPAEAIFRSSVDLTIDLALAGVPILAAAEAGTQILFGSYSIVTGDKAVADAALSSTIKHVASTALDEVAHGAAMLGEASIVLERAVRDEADIPEILANVDHLKLRSYLSRVEDRLNAIPAGHPDEARLMRMREAFRRLIRIKQEMG